MTRSLWAEIESCPVCKKTRPYLHQWGEPGSHLLHTIGGIHVDHASSRFILIQCSRCGYTFKQPRLDQSTLLATYQKSTDRADPNESGVEGIEADLLRLGSVSLCEQAAALHSQGKRVLEVGCSNGSFLAAWSSKWSKYGVEPSDASARVAEMRGIRILGRTIEEVESGQVFDCIISIDVVEHIADPLSFYTNARRLLSESGVIITLTGDCSYWFACIAKARYWYASFPEHISFLRPRTLDYLANRIGGKVVLSQSYAWGRKGKFWFLTWVIQAVKFGAFALLTSFMRIIRPCHAYARRSYPVMSAHSDHRMTLIGDFS